MPHRASPIESRWLEEILARLSERLGSDQQLGATPNSDGAAGDLEEAGLQASLTKYWPTFIKYFNGYDALEKIPVRESLKRRFVCQILNRLGAGQQPSSEVDRGESVLVSVRHW